MKGFISLILLYFIFHLIIIESIRVHKTNKDSSKIYEKSLHASMNILEEDNTNDMIYVNPNENNIYDIRKELTNNNVDHLENKTNNREYDEKYSEANLLDETDFNTMDVLNNKELLHNLKKTYYDNNDIENKKLIKHIKGILSKALHIPSNEINLHDVNVLINKWKIMNTNNKFNKKNLYSDNKYHKEIQTHIPKSTDTIEWEFTHGYDNDRKDTKNNTININYFYDLIS